MTHSTDFSNLWSFLYFNEKYLDNAIREWRQTGGTQPGMRSTSQAVHDPVPSPTVSASRKKQKITQSVPSQPFGGPSPSFHPQAVATSTQPSSSAGKRGPIMGSKGKKQKSVSYKFE